jgi:SAM-dependent methyltransferase
MPNFVENYLNERKFKQLVAPMTGVQYFQLMVDSIEQPVIQGVKMPGFPEEKIQKNFVGSSQKRALREGFRFYNYVKSYCQSLHVPWDENTRIVDFGCGWGRISRFFFKEIALKNFYGVDVDPKIINFCKSAMVYGNYLTVNPEPPMKFAPNSVDVVFAYSVFSHLAEAVAVKWIAEFSRILKPGGLVLATTQGRDFIDRCEEYRHQQEPLESVWHQQLARSFLDVEAAKRDYDSGKFLYSATGGGEFRDKSFYGEALIPPGYVKNEFGRYLTLKDFIDDREKLPQALFVLQKGG